MKTVLALLAPLFLLFLGYKAWGQEFSKETPNWVKLTQDRLQLAKKAYEGARREEKNQGFASYSGYYLWSKRWLDAELDLAKATDQKIAAFQGHLERMKEIAIKVNERVKKHLERPYEMQFILLEAETWVEKAKQRMNNSEKNR